MDLTPVQSALKCGAFANKVVVHNSAGLHTFPAVSVNFCCYSDSLLVNTKMICCALTCPGRVPNPSLSVKAMFQARGIAKLWQNCAQTKTIIPKPNWTHGIVHKRYRWFKSACFLTCHDAMLSFSKTEQRPVSHTCSSKSSQTRTSHRG